MKPRLLLFCWLLSAAAPLRAAPSALVWLAPEGFSAWARLDAALRRLPDLKLTVALTPAMASPIARDALGPWIASGRIEIAARIDGDPILPLVDADPEAPRADDALERASAARSELARRLGVSVRGLAVGAGALAPALVGPLSSSGASWVLVGPYAAPDAPPARENATVFVPARAAVKGPLLAADMTAAGRWVFDESADADSAFLSALDSLPVGARPEQGWTTISETLTGSAPGADAAAVASWPGWDGAAASVEPAAAPAMREYLAAARALTRYQNSGAANLKVLDESATLLRQAQDARFFRAPAPGAPAVSAELRARLIAVYRRLRRSAPDSLYSVDASTASADGRPTGLKSSSGPGWIEFDAPDGSLALPPAAGADPEPWRLRALRVEWSDAGTRVRLRPGRLAPAAASPRPVYDVYIDLNHIVGAGATRLLDGRGEFAAAPDAWEYALSMRGTDATLWRISAEGAPEEVAALTTVADAAAGEIVVDIPREVLRGNPPRWGYLALSYAEDPRRADLSPAAVLTDPDGAVVRGLLAPLEVQQTVFSHPGAPQRIPAARLDAAP